MTRKEAKSILDLAPDTGYITRFSEKREKYVLSVAYPTSASKEKTAHFKITIDDDVSSYALKGSGMSFPTIEDMLHFYEMNPVSPHLGSIGTAYSQMDITKWQEYEPKKNKEEKERQNKKGEEALKRQQAEEESLKQLEEKSVAHQEQLLLVRAEMTEQQLKFQQQMEDIKKEMMDQKRDQKHHRCCLQ